ncbi:unnamed protein product [Victoria cruziana]
MGKENDGQQITCEEEKVKQQVEQMVSKVDELEQRINKVAQFYSSLSKKKSNSTKGNSVKDRERDKVTVSLRRQEAAQREIASEKRMQELIRQFGTILRQIMQHKWAWPFMEPVDVEGLGLHDYYKVIEKPMDFSTIKNLMEGRDGSGYKNVRDIYADVRLVFNNAMKYNVDTDDVHVMAKTLLGKFEEKWLQLLPKVIDEEKRREKEEEEAKMNLQAAEEATVAMLAADLNNELDELNLHLDDLRERVVLKCRVMSTEEKRQLGANLSRLSPEDLTKALEIIAQKNPSFLPTAEEVDLDIDAQSPSTLWRLKFFVKEALDLQARGSVNKDTANPKRKREVNDAVNKNVKKRSKKIS